MWLMFLIIGIVFFALLIDRRNKKINNNPVNLTNPNAKPGEHSNFIMGDNKYNNGG